MANVKGYVYHLGFGSDTYQMYLIAKRAFSPDDIKFNSDDGTFAMKIPSGYDKTGAYVRTTSSNYSFRIGLLDYSTLSGKVDNTAGYFTMDGIGVAIFYSDTREAILYSNRGQVYAFLELLNPVNLSPIGYMAYGDGGAVVTSPNSTVYSGITLILPDPVKVEDTIEVSRVYMFTPLGVATVRRLYSGLRDRTRYNLNVTIGNRKFIQLENFLVDVTDATEVVYYL